MMTESVRTAMHPKTMNDSIQQFDTRFGPVEVNTARVFYFPQCMVGMDEKHRYALADLPSPRLAKFRLLQSLDDEALSFLMLPIALENPFVRREHLAEACQNIDIPLQHLEAMLVVSIQRVENMVSLTVNARAPVLINAATLRGYQCVLRQNEYDIRHPLSM